MMKLEGKTALITGAASGIGAAIARAFAAEGARVAIADVDEEGADRVAAECAKETAGAMAVKCDVASSRDVKAAFSRLDAELGRVDVLVNNAGIVHRGPDHDAMVNDTLEAQMAETLQGGPITTHWRYIETLSDERFDRMLRIHLYGTFYCTREALPRMRRGGGGRIVNMGSIMGSASLAGAPDYCAAKGAIMAFTRATAREAASYGVLVNALAPGFVDTPLLDGATDATRTVFAMQAPLARLGRVEEIAAAAVFLAGPDSSFITGQVLSPNGGIYMSQ